MNGLSLKSLSSLLTLCCLLVVGPLYAQYPTRPNLPEEVVLVVKLLDNDRVQPTTGIVIGRAREDQDHVVIPSAFLSDDPTEDILVLDGGTDVIRDGHLATVVQRNEAEGLAVLQVSGLTRRATRLALNAPEVPHELRLAAYPPADLLASGSLPFWLPVNVGGKSVGEPQSLLEETRIPNLTGPLINLCGQWSGMVLARGTPAANADQAPDVLLGDDLLRIAEEMGLRVNRAPCEQIAPVGVEVEGYVPPAITSPSTVNQRPQERPSKLSALLGASDNGAYVFLLTALASILLFWYFIRRRASQQRDRRIRRAQEAETVTFSATGLPSHRTQTAPSELGTFVPASRRSDAKVWLRIEGCYHDGRPLRAVTALRDTPFKAVIGRSGVELKVDGPGISRRHAVISGDRKLMTISDLGSRNGTYVNGVRCQKDEIFYLKEGDEVLIGAAQVKVRLSPAKG